MTRPRRCLVTAAVLTLTAGCFGAPNESAPDTPATASSDDWPADAVVYHVFVDRFADGDAFEGLGDGRGTVGSAAGVADPAAGTDRDAALMDWMGGDLAGLRARLDHIVDLGANTIWLSPVTPGPGYHGYHPIDLTDVEPRFGDVDALRDLVADAHERGLKVVYDLVLNHTSDQHPWFVAAQADCAGNPYVAWYRFRECPDRYASFAGLPELPELDLDHPDVREWVVDEVLPFWLDDIGVDGFRLDHAQGPSRDFWAFFRDVLDEGWPDTLLLAEVWMQQSIIDSYGEVMDAATAFPLRDRLVAVAARGGDVRALHQPVESLLAGRGPRPATYLSSHDQPRFLHEARGDLARVGLGHGALLTLPGLPVIYYGDEVGLGQNANHTRADTHQDRWFREPMPWDPSVWDTDLHTLVRRLARLRTTTPALHSGEYVPIVTEGPALVFERVLADDRVLVVLVAADEDWSARVGDVVGGLDGDPDGPRGGDREGDRDGAGGTADAPDGDGMVLRDLLDDEATPVHADGELHVDGPGVGMWRITAD